MDSTSQLERLWIPQEDVDSVTRDGEGRSGLNFSACDRVDGKVSSEELGGICERTVNSEGVCIWFFLVCRKLGRNSS